MIAHRAYWSGLVETSNGRTSLLYFAAAVPTVGFVHGAADLNPVNAAALEGYTEARFIKRALPIDTAEKCSTSSPQPSTGWWPLALRWLP